MRELADRKPAFKAAIKNSATQTNSQQTITKLRGRVFVVCLIPWPPTS